MVVFGGYGNGSFYGDLWTLALSGPPTWTKLTPAGSSPTDRRDYAGAVDPSRNRLILHGGLGADLLDLDDTWQLSFATMTWSPILVTGPGARAGHDAVYEPLTDEFVFFAGYSSGYLGDTWRLVNPAAPAWQPFSGPSPSPHLITVRDAPQDQGGRVILYWEASGFDSPSHHTITGYRIWRRAPPLLANQNSCAHCLVTRGPITAEGQAVEFWESLADQPASSLAGYAYTAATLLDSTAAGNPYTAFFVQALTSDPYVFYSSNVDSGYSVDNLSPPAPPGFVAERLGGQVLLRWKPSHAPDVLSYQLFRGAQPDFEPQPSNQVAVVQDTTYTDPNPNPIEAYYKLAAIDLHGNRGDFSLASPDAQVATLFALVHATVEPASVRLEWQGASAAGMTVALLRRTPSTEWKWVANARADASGYIDVRDASPPIGLVAYRLQATDPAASWLSPEFWVEVPGPRFELAAPHPNPANHQLSVTVSLVTGGRAFLEILDVSGRRRWSRDVELGRGERGIVDVGGLGSLPPGLMC